MASMLTLSNLLAWSLQVTLLVAAALAALALLRIDVPALRHASLRLVLLVCLLLPFVQPLGPAAPELAPGRGGAASAAAVFAPVGEEAVVPRPPSPVETFDAYAPPIVAGVIAAGVLARFVWMLAGIHRLRRLRHAGVAAIDPAYDELQRTIGTRATMRWVQGLGQPVTFGFRAPVILLPDSLAHQPTGIQRAVVAHELWHVRRRDWLWTVVEEALRAVFWWHPAMWILLSRIQGTREEVVDRLAIEATGSRRTYVHALLTYAGESPLCGSTAFGRRRHLIRRLLLISKEAVMSARRVVLCGAILGVVTACSGWYAVQAFPMTHTPPQVPEEELFSQTLGPLERHAKPVTPENPIPRRTWHVPAEQPFEATALGQRLAVTMRVTLDQSGMVAETRVLALTARLPPNNMRYSTGGHAAFDRLVSAALPEHHDQLRRVLMTMVQSAARAVRQWRYDPPVDGPISFTVTIPVGGDIESPGPAHAVSTLNVPGATGDAPRVQPGADHAQPGEPVAPLRVGGTIKPPVKVWHVDPMYPPDARAARAQGVVVLECRIEPDGTVSDVRVLRSIPMLDEPAVEAVQQWEFTPTFMNGVPVPVIMTVTVNFTLDQ